MRLYDTYKAFVHNSEKKKPKRSFYRDKKLLKTTSIDHDEHHDDCDDEEQEDEQENEQSIEQVYTPDFEENMLTSTESEHISESIQTFTTNFVTDFDELDEDEISAALIALFYTTKVTQAGFIHFLSFLKLFNKQREMPNNLNQCIKTLMQSCNHSIDYEKRWYCQPCNEFKTLSHHQRRCDICETVLFSFYYVPIITQLQKIISKHSSIFKKKEIKINHDYYEDCYDGEIYQKFQIKSPGAFSFLLNTDGIACSDKSKKTMWPVILVINELPLQQRFSFENIIIAGLTVGESKPDFQVYLKPIVQEMKRLENGLSFELEKGFQKILRFFLLFGVFDKPARASLLNLRAGNAYFSCMKCDQEGENVKTKNNGNIIVYRFKANTNERKYEENLRDAINHSNGKGVVGSTILKQLEFYHITKNSCIDYMHTVCLGVFKRLFKYWFSCRGILKQFIHEIDMNLLRIRPPSFVPKAPRSILLWRMWHANEFLVFFLYYALPLFHELMDVDYFENLIKLVVSIEYLLNRRIEKSKLEYVQILLVTFLKDAEHLYEETLLVSNFHELIHLVQATKDFGPLNNINCFQFEETNRQILSYIHSYDLIGDEFLKVFLTSQTLMLFKKSTKRKNLDRFLSNFEIKSSNIKQVEANDFILKKRESNINLSANFENLFYEYFKFKTIETSLNTCKSFVYKNAVYTNDNAKTKFNDSFICTKEGVFGKIEKILILNESVFVIVRKISKLLSSYFIKTIPSVKSSIFLSFFTDEYFITEIVNIKKAFFIKKNQETSFFFMSTFVMSHLFH